MLKGKERWVVHMRVTLEPVPADGPMDIPLTGVLRRLDALVQAGSAVHRLDHDQKTVRVSQVQFYPSEQQPTHACLLLTYGDVTGADPSFGNMQTGAIRTARKRANEANAVSAHLVVKLRYRTRNGKRWYDALLEDVPGIGKTKIQPVLTALLCQCEHYGYENAEGQQDRARPRFVLEPKESEDLNRDVSRGSLKYFVAVKELEHMALDEEGYIEEVQESRKLLPAEVVDGTAPTFMQRLTNVIRWASGNGYDRVKVVYHRNDGRNRTITLDSPREDAEDLLIKKIDKIELDMAIDQASDSIRAELVERMLDLW